VCGVLAIGGALRLSSTQGTALQLYYLLTAIVAGGLAGLFLLAFLVRRAGRTAAIAGIVVNLLVTAWATLTMNGGKAWNLHHWNYPWHELTIGAVGNTLMFLVGWLVSLVMPAEQTTGPTLWDWIAMNRQTGTEQSLGEPHESLAESSTTK
jgi:SSS family solute:Na+ symporter